MTSPNPHCIRNTFINLQSTNIRQFIRFIISMHMELPIIVINYYYINIVIIITPYLILVGNTSTEMAAKMEPAQPEHNANTSSAIAVIPPGTNAAPIVDNPQIIINIAENKTVWYISKALVYDRKKSDLKYKTLRHVAES